MKTLFFMPAGAFLLFLVLSCGKDSSSKADQNRSLLIGTWNYASSNRSTTAFNADGSVSQVSAYVYFPTDMVRNHITFMNDNQAIMVEGGFGFGLSGSLFVDTVPYKVTDNAILVSFPAGTNTYYAPAYTYPAYMDTLAINFLSADSLSFTRKYHYKHLNAPTELKTCTAQLKKQ